MSNICVDPVSGNLHIVNTAPAHRSNLVVHSNDERSVLKLRKDSNELLSNDLTAYGGIYFERNDQEGLTTSSMILGGNNYIMLATSEDGIVDDPKMSLTWRDGKLGIGKTLPEVELDIVGNIRSSGSIKGNICIPMHSKKSLQDLNAVSGMLVYVNNIGLALYTGDKWIKVEMGEEL
jgi:hypothetical protein